VPELPFGNPRIEQSKRSIFLQVMRKAQTCLGSHLH
jgi:hypothetical protein